MICKFHPEVVSLFAYYQQEEDDEYVAHFPTTVEACGALMEKFHESYWKKTLIQSVFGGTALQFRKPSRINITMPNRHIVYDTCINRRVPPSPLLADLIVHVGLGVRFHERFDDNPGGVDCTQHDAISIIIERLSTLPISSFHALHDASWNEIALRRMIRWLCHPDPLVRDTDNLKMKFRALEGERLAASLSRRERYALWELKHRLWHLNRKSIMEFLFECGTPAATRYPLQRISPCMSAE